MRSIETPACDLWRLMPISFGPLVPEQAISSLQYLVFVSSLLKAVKHFHPRHQSVSLHLSSFFHTPSRSQPPPFLRQQNRTSVLSLTLSTTTLITPLLCRPLHPKSTTTILLSHTLIRVHHQQLLLWLLRRAISTPRPHLHSGRCSQALRKAWLGLF